MSKADELYEQVVALIAEGETEEAIIFLKKALKEKPELGFYNEVVLLAGQYNNWEKKRIRGIVNEESEFNRINSELIDLVEKAKRQEAEAKLAKAKPTPPPPPMSASPDPLRVAQSYQAAPHPRSQAKNQAGFSGQIGTYIKGFFIVAGAIFVIAIVAELMKPAPEDLVFDPSASGAATFTPEIPTAADQAAPEEALLSLEELLEETESANSSSTFSPGDVHTPNSNSLQQQLGNSVWHDENTGYIYFNEAGNYALYYNNWGQVYIQGMTNSGAFTGVYQNSYVGDYGTVFIQPPGDGSILNISYTSSVSGGSSSIAALKQ